MVWFVLASLTAVLESLRDAFSKKGLRDVDEYILVWSLKFFTLPFLSLLLPFSGIPTLQPSFWVALLVSGGLNVVAFLLYIKAIKNSDLSLAVPMVAFTPLFLLVTSPLIVGEFPTWIDLIGILLIVVGSYVLNLKTNRQENRWAYWAPFQALWQEKGARLVLLVAFIWSITSNFDKIGVQSSNAVFWLIASNSLIALVMLPIIFYRSKGSLQQISQNLKALLPIGLFDALAAVCQMTAISLTLVAHVIAIKRTSVLFSVLWGHLFFEEPGLQARLAGASIMVVGVAVITLL
ncbi:EamA family transporter [Leptolyngbya sp. FACHB-261]|uniref:EamA family transporter n=1 Tax=Leptolyngbya sp. FACHB-261 TaxID=2692806 RepID=UPI00168638D4|nr:DMT family transporter [Leptolyngbya sp. FACHB-261]MBD2100818.1 EamA family transporter [Leptolyngbya sp. FACHB-261]